MKTTEDLNLIGLKIFQDDELYTFTSDALLLSKFARVKAGDVVADFCAGVGIVGFNLYGLNAGKVKSVTFFEMQKKLFDLCAENISANGLSDKFTAVHCKIQDIPKEYYGKFSLIVCNPPYRKKGSGEDCKSEEIALCRTEIALDIEELCVAFSRGLKFGGRVCFIHRADRLADAFYFMRKNGIEPKVLIPVAAKKDKAPYAVLIEGVKGGKSGLCFNQTLYNLT